VFRDRRRVLRDVIGRKSPAWKHRTIEPPRFVRIEQHAADRSECFEQLRMHGFDRNQAVL